MRQFNVTVNGVVYSVAVEEVGGAVAPVAGGEKVTAPMPGTVLDVKVAQGASVKKGDIVVILEAMKMENEILAPCDGTVAQIVAGKGASVNSGDTLIVIG